MSILSGLTFCPSPLPPQRAVWPPAARQGAWARRAGGWVSGALLLAGLGSVQAQPPQHSPQAAIVRPADLGPGPVDAAPLALMPVAAQSARPFDPAPVLTGPTLPLSLVTAEADAMPLLWALPGSSVSLVSALLALPELAMDWSAVAVPDFQHVPAVTAQALAAWTSTAPAQPVSGPPTAGSATPAPPVWAMLLGATLVLLGWRRATR